jgi:hypothetical protein
MFDIDALTGMARTLYLFMYGQRWPGGPRAAQRLRRFPAFPPRPHEAASAQGPGCVGRSSARGVCIERRSADQVPPDPAPPPVLAPPSAQPAPPGPAPPSKPAPADKPPSWTPPSRTGQLNGGTRRQQNPAARNRGGGPPSGCHGREPPTQLKPRVRKLARPPSDQGCPKSSGMARTAAPRTGIDRVIQRVITRLAA